MRLRLRGWQSAAYITLLSMLGGACFVPYGGDLLDPHWSADGKEIFYLEQRFLSGPHPQEYFRLWRARPDLQGRTKVASASPSYPLAGRDTQSSADGRYLLFVDHRTLIIYDLVRNRRVWSQTFEILGGLSSSGWADSRTIFLTDGAGLHLVSLPDGASRLALASREHMALAGSRDCRFLLLATGRGWSDGDDLSLFDRSSGDRRVIASVASGSIGPAQFLAGGSRIAYVVQLIGGERSALVLLDLATGESRKIWEGDIHRVSRMESNRDESIFVLSGSRDMGQESSLVCVGSDGSERRTPSEWNVRWDYDPTSDRIISDDAGPDRFAIRTIAELGCTRSMAGGSDRH